MVKLRFLFPMTLLLVAITSVDSAPVSKSIDDPSEALSPRYNVSTPEHLRVPDVPNLDAKELIMSLRQMQVPLHARLRGTSPELAMEAYDRYREYLQCEQRLYHTYF
ncbi:unnamed protein product [Tilletia caries]|uniref:Uncharacterized protein n=1 Tax=Tilletia caries TaxID=13290 RepID=A0A177SWM5_9BASI|nr:hypothetical protein CF336_g9556 [Tilletia laevis]KAE8236534.1 hypothetical protein A4X03_0g9403 [Tilletia caries]CAD6939382.1 unnamed protein product [Tilletia caries]CAD7064497.1 unnamed protein product [Tilletia caries]